MKAARPVRRGVIGKVPANAGNSLVAYPTQEVAGSNPVAPTNSAAESGLGTHEKATRPAEKAAGCFSDSRKESALQQ